MPETAQQYIQRILGHVEGRDAIKVQQATAPKLSKYAYLTQSVRKPAVRNANQIPHVQYGSFPRYWIADDIIEPAIDRRLVPQVNRIPADRQNPAFLLR